MIELECIRQSFYQRNVGLKRYFLSSSDMRSRLQRYLNFICTVDSLRRRCLLRIIHVRTSNVVNYDNADDWGNVLHFVNWQLQTGRVNGCKLTVNQLFMLAKNSNLLLRLMHTLSTFSSRKHHEWLWFSLHIATIKVILNYLKRFSNHLVKMRYQNSAKVFLDPFF